MSLSRAVTWPAIALLFAALAACAYPTRNQEVASIDHRQGYRWNNLDQNPLEDTLVVVTASGGGTRATALALSVLKGLHATRLPNGRSLAQEVDVISSVSGGSVTAGYFALEGPRGFDSLEEDFIRQDGMEALLVAGLNPYGLAKLATDGTERIDLLIDYLDEQLFDGATYQTLLDNRKQPYLLLNAADMVEGVPFSFTQRKFDLLCSDLAKFPLATAVAASAAFPVALSPVTLTNHQPCAAIENTPRWPPRWVTVSLDPPDEDPFAQPSIWYDNPQRTSHARTENAYARTGKAPEAEQKQYVHLLDGGIADNLGVFEPYRMLATGDSDPSFLNQMSNGQITKLVFIVVNARSFADSNLDRSRATPGFLDMLMASISAPIDRTTAGTADQLRELLFTAFESLELNEVVENTALIQVDFDAIADRACRRKFQSIATSWTLKDEEIDGLLQVGGALLANDPDFKALLRITGAAAPALPSLREVCGALSF